MDKEKIRKSLYKYTEIMSMVNGVDVSTNKEFQKLYINFYMPCPVKDNFKAEYFDVFEKCKTQYLSFYEIIKRLSVIKNSAEFSFTTKMLATLDSSLPIWDNVIAKKLLIPGAPSEWKLESRLQYSMIAYERLKDWYNHFLKTQDAIVLLTKFDENFSEYKDSISTVKKIDFMIWADDSETQFSSYM